MELCYVVSVSTLREILEPLATAEARYRIVVGEEFVTLIHYGPMGVLKQSAFPVAYRIPEIPEDEGTLMLMVATERGRETNPFWMPVEKRLLHSSTTLPA
jgi:hypothetical protein